MSWFCFFTVHTRTQSLKLQKLRMNLFTVAENKLTFLFREIEILKKKNKYIDGELYFLLESFRTWKIMSGRTVMAEYLCFSQSFSPPLSPDIPTRSVAGKNSNCRQTTWNKSDCQTEQGRLITIEEVKTSTLIPLHYSGQQRIPLYWFN